MELNCFLYKIIVSWLLLIFLFTTMIFGNLIFRYGHQTAFYGSRSYVVQSPSCHFMFLTLFLIFTFYILNFLSLSSHSQYHICNSPAPVGLNLHFYLYLFLFISITSLIINISHHSLYLF